MVCEIMAKGFFTLSSWFVYHHRRIYYWCNCDRASAYSRASVDAARVEYLNSVCNVMEKLLPF